VPILDLIEQGGDVAAADGGEFALLPRRQDMKVEEPVDLLGRAQAIGVDVPLAPARDHVAEARRGLRHGRQAGAHPLQDLARLLARLVDGQEVGAADRRPDLLAAWIAGHRHIGLGAGGHDTDVVPAQLGIGVDIELAAGFEGRDTLVGKRLAHSVLTSPC